MNILAEYRIFAVWICIFVWIQCSSVTTVKHRNLWRFDDPYINQTIVNAWQNFHKRRYEWAALDFTRLIQKNYIDYDILFGAGVSYLFLNDTAKALEYLTKAIEHNTYHFEAYYFRAKLYLQIGDMKRAKNDLTAVILMEYPDKLLCGYYHTNDDIADIKALQARKKEARIILTSIAHD